MSLRPYIEKAITASPQVISPDLVWPACESLGITPSEFCDRFAAELAAEFLGGARAWSEADAAINALSGFFFHHLTPEDRFPDYAFGVFLAFDAGELAEGPESVRITTKELASLK